MTQLGRYTGNVRDELSYASDHYRQASAGGSTATRSNMRRLDAVADTGALTTQVMTSVALYLRKGDVVTSLTFRSGATPAGTPTNWWFALYSSASTPALLAQTADQTSTAWAANTNKTLALSSPVTIKEDGVYWAAVMVKATTPPSLVGVSTTASAGIVSGEKPLAQTSGSSLTTTAPATIASPTTVATVPLVVAT
ncbi:hypothetical protein HHX38_08390 [Streptomyces sp. PKU-MA01144]|uniref:hypothetical protein n=1 Tax=Streptomyces sp. PKU-MA01144 TaxID=2729138 RepID=UPI00147C2E8D|nr:hypothetical protein [Streptomyces sp. PKU-MA01144]NNJ04152.1 hypothetical protein [Streptomyces sp. PKU-MA01144]